MNCQYINDESRTGRNRSEANHTKLGKIRMAVYQSTLFSVVVFLRTLFTSSFIAQVRFQSKEHKSPRTPKIPGNVLDPPLLSRMHRMVTWSARTHKISQNSLQEQTHLKSFSVLGTVFARVLARTFFIRTYLRSCD